MHSANSHSDHRIDNDSRRSCLERGVEALRAQKWDASRGTRGAFGATDVNTSSCVGLGACPVQMGARVDGESAVVLSNRRVEWRKCL